MHEYSDDVPGVDDPYLELAVEVFSLLADATRARIVLTLARGELSVGEITAMVGKSQAGVSQHLAKLRMSRIVIARQDGNRVYYHLANSHALDLVRTAIQQAEHVVDSTDLRHRDTHQGDSHRPPLHHDPYGDHTARLPTDRDGSSDQPGSNQPGSDQPESNATPIRQQ